MGNDATVFYIMWRQLATKSIVAWQYAEVLGNSAFFKLTNFFLIASFFELTPTNLYSWEDFGFPL